MSEEVGFGTVALKGFRNCPPSIAGCKVVGVARAGAEAGEEDVVAWKRSVAGTSSSTKETAGSGVGGHGRLACTARSKEDKVLLSKTLQRCFSGVLASFPDTAEVPFLFTPLSSPNKLPNSALT